VSGCRHTSLELRSCGAVPDYAHGLIEVAVAVACRECKEELPIVGGRFLKGKAAITVTSPAAIRVRALKFGDHVFVDGAEAGVEEEGESG